MKKILVFKSKENDLNSVNLITMELEALYQQLSSDYEVNFVDLQSEDILNSSLLQKLSSDSPDYITFIHPLVLRNESLLSLFQLLRKKNVTFIFHLYGDFIRQAQNYLNLSDILLGEKCLFLSPSNGYADVIRPFFTNRDNLQVLPFPVNLPDIKPTSRALSKNINIVYTGRISREKNVDLLLEAVKEIEKSGYSCKLHIVGAFDDFESSTIGNAPLLGSLYQKLVSHPDSDRIQFMGFMSSEEMSAFYKTMDLFISLSLYHDDDFGRAPIEALLHGVPCLLTDWLGYKDIGKAFADDVYLLKTTWSEKECRISLDGCVDWLSKKTPSSLSENPFSLKQSVERMKKVLTNSSASFSGFSTHFMEIGLKREAYFYLQDGSFNVENYRKIYLEKKND